jgi:transcriptional regulator with XRE-family HTH domain
MEGLSGAMGNHLRRLAGNCHNPPAPGFFPGRRGHLTGGQVRMDDQMRKSAHPTDKHVGARIRARRMEMDITQSDLGNALGLTFQQVQKYEKGANRISASRLQLIAETLQVELPFFFEGLPGASPSAVPAPDFVAAFISSTDGLALAKAFVKISDVHVRRAIVALVRAMADGAEPQGAP